MRKSTFVKNIGGARWNGYGADLYENANGTASIRFDKLTHPLPHKHYMVFTSLSAAEKFIEDNLGNTGLNTLRNILNKSSIH